MKNTITMDKKVMKDRGIYKHMLQDEVPVSVTLGEAVIAENYVCMAEVMFVIKNGKHIQDIKEIQLGVSINANSPVEAGKEINKYLLSQSIGEEWIIESTNICFIF